ncbi:MAG: hypothetical protein TR69_WS6001001308 [candidate division WS6 bacterium OLB20]|uniref:Uncharacterized protein n=1 Tax=candidate division WS6 bacterium OLB20 TaxID=1617426 RepID=A0A136LWJ0_9BACT|nr:MAG: hypothetical protein TR69_WS6001001308 [candidate division WS6 bacterium OLB20]
MLTWCVATLTLEVYQNITMRKIPVLLTVTVLLLSAPLSTSAAISFDMSPEHAVFRTGVTTGSVFATGTGADNDNFATYSPDGSIFAFDLMPQDEPRSGVVAGAADDKDLILKFAEVNLPLYKQDYYWGKYLNGAAGAKELNKMPVLRPGDRISVIRDGYLTLSPKSGYVRPTNGYYYGSGLCWSTSALGQMMDYANTEFRKKFGIDLFVFSGRDRAPHGTWYKSYEHSNRGYGYTVIKISSGGGQDYSFTVNPAISSLPNMNDFKLKIVMTYRTDFPGAYFGQSIGGYIMTNKDLRLVSYTNPRIFLEEVKLNYTDHFRSFRRSHNE